MNPAQERVLGLIVVVLLLEWVLPSTGGGPSRLQKIWAAATGKAAPTTSPAGTVGTSNVTGPPTVPNSTLRTHPQ